jgi:hypothetical protein
MSHVVFQLKIFRTVEQLTPTQRSGICRMWFSRSTFSIRFSKKVLLIDRGIYHMWFSSSKFSGRFSKNPRLNGRVYITCGFPGLHFQYVSARKSYSSVGVYVYMSHVVFQLKIFRTFQQESPTHR